MAVHVGDTRTGLAADFQAAVGTLRLALALDVAPGEVLAVIGPNGAGKTTLLRALAGLQRIAAGWITLDGRALDRRTLDGRALDRATLAEGPPIHVPPHERGIGYVFQDFRLFPHLSAADNVAFPLRAAGSGETAPAAAREWLDRVGLAGRASARPAELSGGEAARVALARALASEPRLLLLDEPLGAIDVEARQQIREHLRAQLSRLECPCILVTHDPVEAVLLAGRAAVLEGGRVTQTDSIVELTRRPRSAWVARMAGLNLLRGRADGSVVDLGTQLLKVAEPVWGEVFALIRPRSVTLHRSEPEGSARNVFICTVLGLHAFNERIRVELGGAIELVAEVTPAAVHDLELGRGGEVWASVKASEIDVYGA